MGDGSRRPLAAGAGACRPPSGAGVERDAAGLDPRWPRAALWFAPSAAYLWMLPLGAAGLLLCVVPIHNDPLVRVASLVVLAVSASLWLREAHDLSRFVVAIMGRLPIVTPVVRLRGHAQRRGPDDRSAAARVRGRRTAAAPAMDGDGGRS